MATVGPGMVVWGFVLGVLGNVGYESALVYYNAYLPELAPRSHQGRVSAWGFAVGYAGSIAALVAAVTIRFMPNPRAFRFHAGRTSQ